MFVTIVHHLLVCRETASVPGELCILALVLQNMWLQIVLQDFVCAAWLRLGSLRL